LEAAGKPAIVIATEEFVSLARTTAHDQGLPDARIVSVMHPIGGISDGALRVRAETAIDAVLGLLQGTPSQN
jgi:hypothetical protein